jgi:hypothetical protein
MPTTYEVPVITTVTVTVDDNGAMTAKVEQTDPDGAPWIFSSDPTAWNLQSEEWIEGTAVESVWYYAYEHMDHVLNCWRPDSAA